MLQWLTASGTLLAAAVPFVLFLIERRDRARAEVARNTAERERNAAERDFHARELALTEERDRRQAIDLLQHQARRIHVWCCISDDQPMFLFMNTSETPVSSICVEVMANFKDPTDPQDVSRPCHVLLGLDILPPTGSMTMQRRFNELTVFSNFEIPSSHWDLQAMVGLRAFSFLDDASVEWVRRATGSGAGALEPFAGWPDGTPESQT